MTAPKLEPRLCRLHVTLGRIEACPEEACAFWEPGGVVLDGRCAFEQIDIAGRPELAPFLLDLRNTLESACTPEQVREARGRYERWLEDTAGA